MIPNVVETKSTMHMSEQLFKSSGKLRNDSTLLPEKHEAAESTSATIHREDPTYFVVLKDQTILLTKNVLSQKFKHGPVDTCFQLCIPFWLSLILYFTVNTIVILAGLSNFDYVPLPPLDSTGVFNISLGGGFVLLKNPIVYYSPNNHAGVTNLMQKLVSQYPDLSLQGLADESDLIGLFKSSVRTSYASVAFNLSQEQLATGLFVTDQNSAANVSYSIRMNQVGIVLPISTTNNDSYVYNDFSTAADSWWRSGYLTLKQFIDSELAVQYSSVDPHFRIAASVQRYFKNSGLYDAYPLGNLPANRYTLLRVLAPVFLTVILFYPQLSMSTEAVRDTETNMKDLMEISGMFPISFFLSYISASCVLGLLCVCLTLLMISQCVGLVQLGSYIGLMTCYSPSLMAFSLAVSRSARSDSFALPFILLISGLAGAGTAIAVDESLSVQAKNVLSLLFPPVSFANGINAIESYVHFNPGAAYIDVTYVDEQRNIMSVANATGFLVVSSLLWLLVARGYPFSSFFPFSFSSFSFSSSFFSSFSSMRRAPAQASAAVTADAADSILSVSNLTHVYPDGHRAVSNLTLRVKKGEVLVFLGANGSGKTTTLDMISGVLPPTSGDVRINNLSITEQRFEARRHLGVCLQRDILWGKVSVEGHLTIFASLHGLKGDGLRRAVQDTMGSLGFPDKAGCMAADLSGGQRRRLCVGMSMVARNAVVILDEPTAGLDSLSRRQVWEVIQRNRGDRAMVLTTHYMDEADILGDRVVIIKDGAIAAEGTSASLKKALGPGYTLRFSCQPTLQSVDPVVALVRSHVPQAAVSSHAGAELCLALPQREVGKFAALFAELERNLQTLGLLSFGVERCTLEDIFMRVTGDGSAAEATAAQDSEDSAFMDNVKVALTRAGGSQAAAAAAGGGQSAAQQVSLMLRKRFLQLTRSAESWATMLVLPILGLVMCMSILQVFPTAIISDSLPSATAIRFGSYVGTTFPISASSESCAVEYATAAGIPAAEVLYTGASYAATQSYVSRNEGSSSDALFFRNASVFSVMYNAQQPLNLASVLAAMNEGAVENATSSKMSVSSTYGEFPAYNGYLQIYIALAFSICMALFSAVFAGGAASVLAGERLTLLKHQQLFSGASRPCYWVANTAFDAAVLFGLTFLLAVLLATAYPSFQAEGFLVALTAGLCFSLAAVSRLQLVSFIFTEARSVHTVFIYGTVMLVVALTALYIQIIAISASSSGQYQDMFSFNTPGAVGILCFATFVEPAMGYIMIILFQMNYLGVRDNVGGYPSALDPRVGGYLFGVLFSSAAVNAVALVCAESRWPCCSGKQEQQQLDVRSEPTRLQLFVNSFNLESAMKPLPLSALFRGADTDTDRHRAATARMNPLADRSVGDPAVRSEQVRVDGLMRTGSTALRDNPILVHRVSKLFAGNGITTTDKLAVNCVSVGIPAGEIFGLIGANGAGKTTLLRIVSGLDGRFAGDALIAGFSITARRRQAQMSMGFCPQFDTLVLEMTVRENLLYFAVLKGLSAETVDDAAAKISSSLAGRVVQALMAVLGILGYADKRIRALSGGTRRKVSLAVALMGAPPTAYLDEPSTGLDCTAYRHMWKLLRAVASAQTTAVVLTTHNMRECEAVCGRIAIMKNGSLVALGSAQQLRTTHGSGYQLEMSVAASCSRQDLHAFVQDSFPGAAAIDRLRRPLGTGTAAAASDCGDLLYSIPHGGVRQLSEQFALLEANKHRLGILDYSLSQNSLDEVFIEKIRPEVASEVDDEDELGRQLRKASTQPNGSDYRIHYLLWLLSALVPGLHRYCLGDYWNAVAFFLTANWCMLGWWLDFWRLPRMVQLSVAKYGHASCCCDCSACGCDRHAADAHGEVYV